MICKICGADTPNPMREPLWPKLEVPRFDAAIPPVKLAIRTIWACLACGRYHKEDGSLYEPNQQEA